MKITVVTPAPRGSRKGNRVSADRWAAMLRELGHRVTVTVDPKPRSADVLFALHARRSAEAVARFRERFPQRPILLALTGTDLYVDLPRRHRAAAASVNMADRLLVLQPRALDALSPRDATKARVVPQSVARLARPPARRTAEISVVGHLRQVKDPMRAAMASRSLPAGSRITVVQAGAILEPSFRGRVEAEMLHNPRYRWLGELSRRQTLRLIARSSGVVVSSRAEGGAHVVSEAIVHDTPVLASDIPGNVGMLGDDYPGLFPVGHTKALASLMRELEERAAFRERLRAHLEALAPTYRPANERRLLGELVAELG